MSSQDLADRLEKHPRLKAQIEKMLDMAESRHEILLADDAEDFVVEEGRNLNRTFLEEWAEKRAETSAKICEERHKSVRKDVKKNSTGIRA